MSIARWLLVAAVLACTASAGRVDATAADGTSSRCTPAPTVPGVTEGSSLPGTIAPSVGSLRAILLLVHVSDARPDDSTDPPQKLLDAAKSWFAAISYGRLDFRVETLERWLQLPARSRTYVEMPGRYLADAVAAADPYVDFSVYDVVYLAASSSTPEWPGTYAVLNSFGVRADGREVRFWVPFGAGFASFGGDPELLLHETGHLLGLPDLYLRGAPATFHRWDLMTARWPSELLAWHRWKLGWLEASQVVCLAPNRVRTVRLTPLERAGGVKAVFVEGGSRVLAVEVRDRLGYDASVCETGVLVYQVDQTPFRRAPVRIIAAQSDRSPPRRGCGAAWNAPFDATRGERRTLSLKGFRLDVLAKRADGSYRVRITTR